MANYCPVPPFAKAEVGWIWLSGALGHQPVSMGAGNETWLAVSWAEPGGKELV